MQDPDRRDVGQRRGNPDVRRVELPHGTPKQIQRTDRRLAQAKRDGVHRREALFERRLPITRPLGRRLADIRHRHHLPGREAHDAGAGLRTQLHEFDETRGLTRRGNDLQVALLIHEEDARRRDVEHPFARLDQGLQEIDDIEARHEGVRERGEGFEEVSILLLLTHRNSRTRRSAD